MSDWKTCSHEFYFAFGPVKKCKHCGATTIASFDGTPKDIWPPVQIDKQAFLGPSEDDMVPSEYWSTATKTPEALANACCPCCGEKPESLNPLPLGWCWDTMAPTNNYVWCPIWTREKEDP